ncbi:MAG: hypothetical protein LUH18_09345 [Oscillospiraceae bacterium]|nr:hypothetical protein [Oscillospiraceae bacterium]
MNLKETLFLRAKAEIDGFTSMGEDYDEEEKEIQRARYMGIYKVIIEAGLEDEYLAWRYEGKKICSL